MKSLITFENAKTTKGEALGYLTGILYLAPYDLSGRNVCPYATEQCVFDCLNMSGRGVMAPVQEARIRKTRLFHRSPDTFVEFLDTDIQRAKKMAVRRLLQLVLRLNGTSDLSWERYAGKQGCDLMERHPDLTFYDYTKNPQRMEAYLEGRMPKNYKLTFSRSEKNEAVAFDFVKRGGNVAAVFGTKKGQALPSEYRGVPVIDGDVHDLRFLDPQGVIVGLRAKGRARKRRDGFVIWS